MIKNKVRIILFIALAIITIAFSGCVKTDADLSGAIQKVERIPVIKWGQEDTYIDIAAIFEQKNADQNQLALSDLLSAETVALYTADSDIIIAPLEECSLNIDGTIAYEDQVVELIGIMLDPPDTFVYDTARYAEESLDLNKKILIIYLDGFGYESYEEAKAKGIIPYMGSLDARLSASVMPSVTVVNFASMVSGTTPKYNGVLTKENHILQAETVFDKAIKDNLQTLLVESDIQIIQLNGKTEYHVDVNGDGDTDDEIFYYTQNILKQEPQDLVLVHFHGIDDRSHAYGPHTEQVLEKISVTDQYVKELAELWQGEIIIVADHGQHLVLEEDDGKKGTHGDFRSSDIFTPFLVRQGIDHE